MTSIPSYEELAEALAKHIHTGWCLDMPNIVDDMCVSHLQIPAGVLVKLGILECEVPPRHWRFTCGPSGFKALIRANKDEGCSYDTVVLAAILAVSNGMGWADKTELISHLSELGLCKPRSFDGLDPATISKISNTIEDEDSRPVSKKDCEQMSEAYKRLVMSPDGRRLRISHVIQTYGPVSRYVWTDERKKYDDLYHDDWPSLIE